MRAAAALPADAGRAIRLAPEVDSFGKRFKHVPETLDLDSQPVTAGRAQRLQVPSLADQPSVPTLELARAIGLQSLRVPAPLVALQPRSLPDPAGQCRDQALRPAARAGSEPAGGDSGFGSHRAARC